MFPSKLRMFVAMYTCPCIYSYDIKHIYIYIVWDRFLCGGLFL